MNVRAHHKYIKVSPKKIRFVAKSVKKLKPTVAMAKLQLVQNRSAKVLYKAIKSAVDNAVSVHKATADTFTFSELKIDEGIFLRRMRPGARGTGKPYHRKTSHITVVLEVGQKTAVKALPAQESKDAKVQEAHIVTEKKEVTNIKAKKLSVAKAKTNK